MRYPLQLANMGNVELFVPTLVKETYEKELRINPAASFPFWAKIWASGYELASFLQEDAHYIQNKNILELGAGIALPSFSIAQFASEILISDYNPDAVELMKKNISHLQLNNIHAQQIDWNDFPSGIKADVLLLSDINYDDSQFTSLFSLIQSFLAQNTTIIIATPQRINITPFAEALRPFIKRSELRMYQQEVEIRILVLKMN